MKLLSRMTKIALAVGLLIALTNSVPSAAVAAEGKHFKVGVLTCAAGPKIGLLIASKQKISCSFQPDAHGAEHYSGVFGIK